jgi:hypothetical protein
LHLQDLVVLLSACCWKCFYNHNEEQIKNEYTHMVCCGIFIHPGTGAFWYGQIDNDGKE